MGPVVGIDLGTTNTVVAVVRDGQAAALADSDGHRLLPSVVSFHPGGNVLVGREAKARRLMDGANTVYSIKRLIGRSWDSDEVQRARARFPFLMKEGPGKAALVVARNETYTLPEISAFVLRKAKAIAEAALGTAVERAVITVPANFNDLQRAATKVAGRVAGLEVLRILNEPTAAALAYGYGKQANERIAVYDFGGGTFDVTLLDLSDNVFEVLATAGNSFLGGDDLDLAIAEQMAAQLLAETRLDARQERPTFERLRSAAEEVKMALSERTETEIVLDELGHGAGGRAISFRFSMSRAELERLARPIVDRTFDTCREALGVARLSPSDFDRVLLVGGSTRVPMVRQRVEEFFQREALHYVNPDEVVAIGAAIQASALTGAERRRSSEIPSAPRPAARTQPGIGRSRSRPPGRGGTLPPGTKRPSGVPPEAIPGPPRARMATNPGIQPEEGAVAAGRPRVVVPPPEGFPSQPSPQTADVRQRRITAPGAGAAPPPETVAGLGPRGRVVTGSGLGPAAGAARRDAATLMSASVAAGTARTTNSTVSAAALDAGWSSADSIPPGGGEPLETLDADDLGLEDDGVDELEAPADPDAVEPPPVPPRGYLPTLDSAGARAGAAGARAALGTGTVMLDASPVAAAPFPDGATDRTASGAWVLDEDVIAPYEPGPAEAEEEETTHAGQAASRQTGPTAPAAAPRGGFGSTVALGAGAAVAAAAIARQTGRGAPAAAASFPPLPLVGGEAPPGPPADPRQTGADPRRTGADPRRTGADPRRTGAGLRRTGAGFQSTFEIEEEAESSLPIPGVPDPGSEAHAPPQARPVLDRTQVLTAANSPRMTPVKAPFAPSPLPLSPGARPAAAPAAPPPGWGAPAPAVAPPPPPLPTAAPAAGPAGWGLAAAAVTAPLASPVIRDMAPAAPVLVDVTPLSLSVETVGGFCDTVIERNSPVPCERAREFATAADNQTTVRVRVSQGESQRFAENTLLGELELSGLRPAPRGTVQLSVTFALDTDGMLNVSARDVETGRHTTARVRLVAAAGVGELAAMLARQQPQVV